MTTSLPRAGRSRLAVAATAGILAAGLIVPAASSPAAAAAARALGPPNTWVAVGQMDAARSGQTATLLRDGQVLVAGGGTASAQLYDPATRAFRSAGRMPMAVTDATATLLPDGQVLVAGGQHGGHQVASAELYDPAAGTWTATGSMNVPRSGQTATLLPGGQVLVAGGGCNGFGYGCNAGSALTSLRSAELYNPATGSWALTGSMRIGRQFHTATLLPDGDVLAAGGFASCDDDFCYDTSTAELYNPAAGTWASTGPMSISRDQHTATLLPDGEVLAAGGFTESGGGGHAVSSAELYDPATGTWSPTASMATTHAGQTATLLRSGWVLVAGGRTAVAEIYEPQRAIWVSPGAMSTVRTGQTATLLPDGYVLAAGGDGPDGQPQATAEEFLAGNGPLVTIAPASVAFGGQQVGTISGVRSYQVSNVGSADLTVTGVTITGRNPGDFRASSDCDRAPVAPGGTCTMRVRFAPAATSLRTAAAGASDNAPGSPQGAPVSGYGVGPNAWAPVGSMTAAREHATATLLPDGQVLIAGGETGTDSSLASAELYNPATRSFSTTGPLNAARAYPAATLLPDGQVLITGGLTSNFNALSSAELYNPATGTWSYTTPMNAVGYAQTSTLLPDGSVLVTGFGGGTNTGEVYDPATATWSDTGPMTAAQFFATATLLPGGQVLLAAGATSAAELYDRATNDWTATGSLHVARQSATATLLRNGNVLVAGGEPPSGEGNALASSELYHPVTGTWSVTASMNTGRYGAAAVLLRDGLVLITGGCSGACGDAPALASAEVYNRGFWYPVADMTQPRIFQTATLLPDGTVLVAGGCESYYGTGTATAEFYTTTLLAAHPASGPAGSQVTVSGSGFYAGESVTLYWDGGAVLGHAITSASGTFTTKITIPAAAPGKNLIAVRGHRSFAGASTTFTVTG